jgi:hypothetical protein
MAESFLRGHFTHILSLRRHWKRAFRYARREDWVYGAGMAAVAPAFMLTTERFAPSFSGRGAFPPVFRLSCAMGLIAGAYLVWERSSCMSHPRFKVFGVWLCQGYWLT